MQYQYQVDYGNGYENVYPDGYGMHSKRHRTAQCQGCWDESDHDTWFAAVEEQGAVAARILFGGQEIEERIFEEATND